MRKVLPLLIATSLMASTAIFAETQQHSVATSVTTPHTSVNTTAKVESPNVLHNLGSKTASTLDKAGTATVHGIDQGVSTVVDKTKSGWEHSKEFGKEKTADAKDKLTDIKTATKEKAQHTKNWSKDKVTDVKTDSKALKNNAENQHHETHIGISADGTVQHN